MEKVLQPQKFLPPAGVRPIYLPQEVNTTMLIIVFCRFHASIVKQNLNFFAQNLPRKWWATTLTCLKAVPVSVWHCYSDFEKTLINVIISCQNQVNTGQEIISSSTNFYLVEEIRGRSFNGCPPIIIHSILARYRVLAWGKESERLISR